MGVHNPVESAEVAYSASKETTTNIVSAIKGDRSSLCRTRGEDSGDTHQIVQTAAGARSGKVGYSVGVDGTNEEVCNHESG